MAEFFEHLRARQRFALGEDREAVGGEILASDLGDLIEHFVAGEEHERAAIALSKVFDYGAAGGLDERGAAGWIGHAGFDVDGHLTLEVEG